MAHNNNVYRDFKRYTRFAQSFIRLCVSTEHVNVLGRRATSIIARAFSGTENRDRSRRVPKLIIESNNECPVYIRAKTNPFGYLFVFLFLFRTPRSRGRSKIRRPRDKLKNLSRTRTVFSFFFSIHDMYIPLYDGNDRIQCFRDRRPSELLPLRGRPDNNINDFFRRAREYPLEKSSRFSSHFISQHTYCNFLFSTSRLFYSFSLSRRASAKHLKYIPTDPPAYNNGRAGLPDGTGRSRFRYVEYRLVHTRHTRAPNPNRLSLCMCIIMYTTFGISAQTGIGKYLRTLWRTLS